MSAEAEEPEFWSDLQLSRYVGNLTTSRIIQANKNKWKHKQLQKKLQLTIELSVIDIVMYKVETDTQQQY